MSNYRRMFATHCFRAENAFEVAELVLKAFAECNKEWDKCSDFDDDTLDHRAYFKVLRIEVDGNGYEVDIDTNLTLEHMRQLMKWDPESAFNTGMMARTLNFASEYIGDEWYHDEDEDKWYDAGEDE